MADPYQPVRDFEEAIAEYCDAPYAVATDSCTSALFLSLMYRAELAPLGEVEIPKFTYPSVPCSIIHAGGRVKFVDKEWKGFYELGKLKIYDGALRFEKGMYLGGFHCLSFHIKKHLPIGRGGMILTENERARDWFRKARFDGRAPVPLLEDNLTMLGWNCYMDPTQAARGLQLLQAIGDKELPDLPVKNQGYPDLSKFPIYAQSSRR